MLINFIFYFINCLQNYYKYIYLKNEVRSVSEERIHLHFPSTVNAPLAYHSIQSVNYVIDIERIILEKFSELIVITIFSNNLEKHKYYHEGPNRSVYSPLKCSERGSLSQN